MHPAQARREKHRPRAEVKKAPQLTPVQSEDLNASELRKQVLRSVWAERDQASTSKLPMVETSPRHLGAINAESELIDAAIALCEKSAAQNPGAFAEAEAAFTAAKRELAKAYEDCSIAHPQEPDASHKRNAAQFACFIQSFIQNGKGRCL